MHTGEPHPDLSVCSHSEVLAGLNSGDLLVCATSGLAAQWRQRYVLHVVGADGVCETPQILSWQVWVQQLSEQVQGMPVALNDLQERLLWEAVIARDMRKPGHAQSAMRDSAIAMPGLARQAAAAFRLLAEYRVPLEALEASHSEEGEALARWIRAMREALQSGELSERMLVADVVSELAVKIDSLSLPKHMMLDGFESLSPAQLHLLQAVQACGSSVLRVGGGAVWPEDILLISAADEAAEFRHVAMRIRDMLDEHPQQRIAIVTVAQAFDARLLRRILDEVLLAAPQTMPEEQAVAMVGEPLASLPMIRQLLHLLSLAGRTGAAFDDAAKLLFFPGLKGYAGERMQRAQLDVSLRESNRHYVSFKSLLSSDALRDMPALADVLKQLLVWKTVPLRAGEWVKSVHALLQASGFLQLHSGQPPRTAFEVRQLNAFRDCLSSLVAAEGVSERLEWTCFLSLLMQACSTATLALPVRYPQLSVVPLSEIAGLRFDALFVVGLNDQALPLPVRMHPLLPPTVQRHYRLPYSSPALAYASSVFLWQQLQQTAAQLQVSYARHGDGQEQAVSPLLAGFAEQNAALGEAVNRPIATEVYDDAREVPLSAGEGVHGGSALIKNQSACPFHAFAAHRLCIAPLGETEPGINAADKGSLMHRALEYVWQQLQSRQALVALDAQQRDGLIGAAVQHAWQKSRMTVGDVLRDVEQQRMHGLLSEWLDKEIERPDFSVQACERSYRLRLPQHGEVYFPLHLKIDRIDVDADGHRILIDYKTGKKQGGGQWIGKRMSEPQLPLYTVAAELSDNDAVCFARLRSGDMGFEGLCADGVGIRGVEACDGKRNRPEDWRKQLQEWRRDIDALADEFVRGRCEVMPRDAHACDYCGLEGVCRIDELGFARTGPDGEAGQGQ